jgi:hypothetical protein
LKLFANPIHKPIFKPIRNLFASQFAIHSQANLQPIFRNPFASQFATYYSQPVRKPIRNLLFATHSQANLQPSTMQKGDRFESIAAAYDAIKAYILNQGESFKTVASDKKRYMLACKDKACGFKIRVWHSTKDGAIITTFEPHLCSPVTHYKASQS